MIVDGADGSVDEAWRDYQVETPLARGYEGAIAQKVNSPWIWLPLCLLFIAPFFDPRRPLRLLHLDLLVLLGLGLSLFFFNRAEITASVALTYPVLGYFLIRMLVAGFWPRQREGPLVPLAPIRWLAIGVLVLGAGRIALNIVDSHVIDIGVAGVIGADRITGGEPLYEGGFSPGLDLQGRRLRPVQLPRLRPVRADLPLGRRSGTPGCRRRPRRRDRLRPHVHRRARRARAPAARRRAGPGARLGARLRLGRLPVDALHDERQRQRRADRGARDRRAARAALGAGARGAHRRSRPRPSSAPRRWRRCSRPPTASGAGAARCRFSVAFAIVGGGRLRPLPARRRPARALRPHARLPGDPQLAVQRLGPGAVARVPAAVRPRAGARRSRSRSRSCRGARRRSRSPRSPRR